MWITCNSLLIHFTIAHFLKYMQGRVSHSPTFVSNLFRMYLIWSHMISEYPKHNFFPEKKFLDPHNTPLSLKKWIFKLLRLPCLWYSKLVPWDADRLRKGIGLIRSLSKKKTSKTCQNIGNFQIKQKCGYYGIS